MVGTGGAVSVASGQAAAAAAAAIAAANNDTVDSSKTMFNKKTKAIVWGMQTRAVQVKLIGNQRHEWFFERQLL